MLFSLIVSSNNFKVFFVSSLDAVAVDEVSLFVDIPRAAFFSSWETIPSLFVSNSSYSSSLEEVTLPPPPEGGVDCVAPLALATCW